VRGAVTRRRRLASRCAARNHRIATLAEVLAALPRRR
jgi:hypothetical protein